jgi:succinate-semialdehyde dehydrogenase / glutarate-semialdehyde dehydrogenase
MSYQDTQLLINNEWREAASKKFLTVVNPSTGTEIGRVAQAGQAEMDVALESAAKGFEVWRNTPVAERQRVMRKAATLLSERVDSIALLMTLEQAFGGVQSGAARLGGHAQLAGR